jgi:uncharacterized protein (TIGR04255 family)
MNWEPARADHSIDKATASVVLSDSIDANTFDELVVAVRKAVAVHHLTKRLDLPDAIELEASAEGLIKIGTDIFPGSPPRRVVFQRPEADSGTAVDEVSVGMKRIAIGTLRYRRWDGFFNLIITTMEALDRVYPVTKSVKMARLEFVDRFESMPGGADHFEVVSRDSKFLASAVRDKTDAFHVHSGWFDFEGKDIRRLTNVNVDVGELPRSAPEGRRKISILSMGQYEALNGILDDPLARLSTLHDYLKDTFRSTITTTAAARVALND